MGDEDTKTLLKLSGQIAELQRQMHQILKTGVVDINQLPETDVITHEQVSQEGQLVILSPENASERVGNMLRIFRQSAGLTQSDVGRISCKQKEMIGRVERGGTNPTIETVTTIAAAIGADTVIGLKPKDADEGP